MPLHIPTPLRYLTRALLIVDLFCGGGGVSYAIREALDEEVAVAVNHDPAAIEMHARNHPQTMHFEEDVFEMHPWRAVRGRQVDLLWASPDCRHFSRARGGKPRDKGIRSLADVVILWAQSSVAPRVICVENVPEFITWGPLDDRGKMIKSRQGEHFQEWVRKLEEAGYVVEWRILTASDYGDPTSRRRWFCVARRDGEPIVWPVPTHGPRRAHPYRTAAECIDWSIPCPSIFERERPLADATQRRVAAGLERFLFRAAEPFIVNLTHGARLESLSEPMKTITAAHRGEKALVAPTLVQTGYGERKGQAPRVLDLHEPLGTVVAAGQKHALAEATLQHASLTRFQGRSVGQDCARSLGSITSRAKAGLLGATLQHAHLHKHYGGPQGHQTPGQSLAEPMGAVTSRGQLGPVSATLRHAEIVKYYGQGTPCAVDEPLHTTTARHRFGLVEVQLEPAVRMKARKVADFVLQHLGDHIDWYTGTAPMYYVLAAARRGLVTVKLDGEIYVVTDIGLRMLQPRELARAHSFPDDYILTGTKSQQIARIGRSVPVRIVEAIVRAQFSRPPRWGQPADLSDMKEAAK